LRVGRGATAAAEGSDALAQGLQLTGVFRAEQRRNQQQARLAGLVFNQDSGGFMQTWKKVPIVWLALAGGIAPIMGCEEGPLEEAGEEIDDAVDDAKDAVD
jgi:hypothetical protein